MLRGRFTTPQKINVIIYFQLQSYIIYSHKLFIVINIAKQESTMTLEHLLVLFSACLTFCCVQSGKGWFLLLAKPLVYQADKSL